MRPSISLKSKLNVEIVLLIWLAHSLTISHVIGMLKEGLTVMILSFRTDRSGQTVQTQIRDQGLHCLQFRLHRLGALLFGKATLFKF